MPLRASKHQESGDAHKGDSTSLALQKAYLDACEYPEHVGSQMDHKNSSKFVGHDKGKAGNDQKPLVSAPAKEKDKARQAEKEPVGQTMARKFANSKSTGPAKDHEKKHPISHPQEGDKTAHAKEGHDGHKYEALHKKGHTSAFAKKVADYHSK